MGLFDGLQEIIGDVTDSAQDIQETIYLTNKINYCANPGGK